MKGRALVSLAFVVVLSLVVGLGPSLVNAQQGTPSPAASPGAAPPGQIPSSQPAGADWLTNGGNLFNQRYSSLDQVTANNVSQLKGAWTFKTGSMNSGSSFESTPIVSNGVMYLTGPHSQVWALDAKTGKQLWSFVPQYSETVNGVTGVDGLPLCCGQDNRGVAIGDGMVYVAQLDAKLTALDAKTGKVVWTVQVGNPAQGFSETAAPLFYDHMIFIGISGAEYEIRGYVTAYDAANGKQLWRFYTIPGPGQPGHDTWAGNSWQYGGGPVWNTPSLDPQLGLLYFSTGNASPDLDGAGRAGNNLYTESILALNYKTGTVKWYYQEVHHDIWDYDATSPTVLFDVEMNGQMVKGIGQAGKTGWVYLLNRETGKPIVPIPEKPVPQDAEQHTAATQPFPQGDSFVPQKCTEPIDGYPMGPIYTPFEDSPVLICPGANGGSEWSPTSYNPQTHEIYTCGIVQPQIWTRKPAEIQPGTLRLGSAFLTPPGGKTSGTFSAIDVTTNKIGWQDQWANMCIGGSLTTAGNLVFAGKGDGNFVAYNAKTGKQLWQFQTGAGANAPAMTYEIDGQQYVAVASGGNFQLDYPRGDTLWVFALNGTMGPAAAPKPPSAEVGNAIATNSVKIVDYAFDPGTIIVKPGTTVTWVNDGKQPHTTTSSGTEKSTVKWDSGIMKPGQSYSFTFTTPGSYTYFCTLHPIMRGVVIVATNAPPLAASPSASPPAGGPGTKGGNSIATPTP